MNRPHPTVSRGRRRLVAASCALGLAFLAPISDATATPTELPPVEPVETPTCGGDTLTKPDGTPWTCTYDDEFDGDTLDRHSWVPQVSATSGFYSGTAAVPACFTDSPDTISVHDGHLNLSTQVLDTPLQCGTKSVYEESGMVSQLGTFSQTYGKYEVRAKLPDWTTQGLQETFWLWPNDVLKYGPKHPDSGEIDFAEFYSKYPNLVVPVMHYDFDPSTINLTTNTNIYTWQYCKIHVGDFNTYGLEWYPGQLKILVNGQVCITNNYIATNAPAGSPYAPFDQPFFLALTQAFGTTGNEFNPFTGPRTASTQIDYVRIWQ